MFKTIFYSATLSAIFIVLRFVPILFHKERYVLLSTIDIVNIILEWIFTTVVFSFLISISFYFQNPTQLAAVFLAVLLCSFLVSYGYFIYPFLIIFRQNRYKICEVYQEWVKLNIDKQIVVRILKHNMVNAYATGILSVSKVILLSDKMLEEMQEKDIKNVIFHEYGHLKNNHLLFLYLSNVLCVSVSVISGRHFIPIFETTSIPGLLVALHGALLGGLYMLVSGLVQRQLEYKADKYASKIVGAASYSETLIALNVITNGGLEKKSINYPTLKERLKNVSEE